MSGSHDSEEKGESSPELLLQQAARFIAEFPSTISSLGDVKRGIKLSDPDPLTELTKHIRRLERLKYPEGFVANHYPLDTEPPMFFYVKAPLGKLSDAQLNHMRHYSELIRKLSIIAGMLKFAGKKDYVNEAIKIKLINIVNAEIAAFKPVPAPQIQLSSLLNQGRQPAVVSELAGWKVNKSIKVFTEDLARLARETDMNPLNPNIDLGESLPIKIPFISRASRNSKAINKAISQVRNAEKYFLADMQAGQIFVNETPTSNDQTYFQMDIPFTHNLTEEQKREFIRIHSHHDQPVWFKDLKLWEQEYYKERVPITLNDDKAWEKFSIFKSSAIQNTPGISNARYNYVWHMDFSGIVPTKTLFTQSIKTATPVPYEMGSYTEKLAQTKNNILQTIAQALPIIQSSPWDKLFTDSGNDKPTSLIYFQSLLSNNIDKNLGLTRLKAPDVVIEKIQREAMREIQHTYNLNNIQITYSNDPVNFLRWFSEKKQNGLFSSPLSKVSGGLKEDWTQVEALIKRAKIFIKQYEMKAAEPGDHDYLHTLEDRYHRMVSAIENLKNLHDLPTLYQRNRAAHKTMFVAVLVEAMGGIVITNCKSGKDRTGLNENYHLAARHYASANQQNLPEFDAKEAERKKYIDAFELFFKSQKSQQAASFNTLGSMGIKDSALMLCRDIVNRLGNLFDFSNENSAANKPAPFAASEVYENKLVRSKNTKSKATILSNTVDWMFKNQRRKQYYLQTLEKSMGAIIQPEYNDYIIDANTITKDISRVIVREQKMAKSAWSLRGLFGRKVISPLMSVGGGSPFLAKYEFAINYIESVKAPATPIAVKDKPYFLETVNDKNEYQLSMHKMPKSLDKAHIIRNMFLKYHQHAKLTVDEIRVLKAACKKIYFDTTAFLKDPNTPPIINTAALNADELAILTNMKFESKNRILDFNDMLPLLAKKYFDTCLPKVAGRRQPCLEYQRLAALQVETFMAHKVQTKILTLHEDQHDVIMKEAVLNYLNTKRYDYMLGNKLIQHSDPRLLININSQT